jgi:RNA 2',3'-cyclic 3'-phosphodiesterase
MRVFAAIKPPTEALDHLENALAMLGELPPAPIRLDRRAPARSRRAALRSPWTQRDTWHITLVFFGEVPDGAVGDLEGAVAAAVEGTGPMSIHLAGAGTFRNTVLWVGVGGQTELLADAMHELVAVRGEFTTLRDNHERNRAHLTVSRAGATIEARQVVHALSVYRGPEWTVDEVELVESRLGAGAQGRPVHTTLAAFRV